VGAIPLGSIGEAAMSNIFIRQIVGSGAYAIPESDAELAAATSGLDALISGIANLSYGGVLAWVEDSGGPGGAEGTRTLNCLVQTFTFFGEECPPEEGASGIDTLVGLIESTLEGDPNISSIDAQHYSLYQAPSSDLPISFPDIQQVLYVDKTSGSYTADGTVQYPYNSINDALDAALLLTPSVTNRIGIVVMPGIYNERFRLRNYCYVIGMDRDACILTYGAGTTILATDVISGVSNMTIDQTGTSYLVWAETSVGTVELEFHSCRFINNGSIYNNIYTDEEAVVRCYDCDIEAPTPDDEVAWCYGDSSQYFYNCRITGLIYAQSGSSARLYIKDCDIKGCVYTWGYNSFEVFNTNIDASDSVSYPYPVYIGGTEALLRMKDCSLIPAGIAKDIWFASKCDIEMSNVRMVNGIDRFGFIITDAGDEAYIGGNVDCYSSWTNMVQAGWTGRGKHTIYLRKDILEYSINLSGIHDPVVIDGQGLYSWTSASGTINVSTGWSGDNWQFKNITFNSSLQTSIPSSLTSSVKFQNCLVNGTIKTAGGPSAGNLTIELDHTTALGTADSVNALELLQVTGGNAVKVIVSGDSYLQGYVGNPAVWWRYGDGPADLRMLYSTILHGSLGANNPFGDDGGPTTPISYRATHCRFNADPDLSPNYLNAIAAGQRYNSFDPGVALY
jgi:hypothetical protein